MNPLPLLMLTPALLADNHIRAEQEHAFDVALPAEQAFVLFEPLGEKNWAEDWQPVFAVAGDARAHDGTVFTVTRQPTPATPAVTSVWTIVRHDPARLIEYHNVIIGVRATRITVRCEAAGKRRTRVTVRYVYTGLSDRGDQAIRQMTEAEFAAMIDGWGAAIADYLRRGTPASA